MRNRATFLGVMVVSLGLGSGCVIDLTPDGGDTSSSSSTGGAGGGSGGSGGGPVGEAPPTCAELGGDAPDPGYPGIDGARFASAEAVAGCAKAFDGDAKQFTLGVSGATRISIEDGQLFANGTKCTAKDGGDVALDDATSIVVSGTDGDDALLLELDAQSAAALGTFALAVDLGAGDDRLLVRGSAGADAIEASEADGAIFLDGDADGDAEIRASGAELLVVSLGDGDDRFDAAATPSAAVSTPVVACGGAGGDTLRGGLARDELEGGQGDDTLRAAEVSDGADVLDGGDGIDAADYAARSSALTIRLDGLPNDGEASELDDVRVEHVVGGAGSDAIEGSDAADRLDGGPGDDTIDGRGGDDVVDGGPGDDTFATLSEPDGADTINGGEGSDLIDYEARPAGIVVTLCQSPSNFGCDETCSCAADDGQPSEGDRLVNVESARGTSFADVLTGDAGDNRFFGNGGDDVLRGGDGYDSLFGDAGADALEGGEGDDYLDGGDGADVFAGGSGQGDICVVAPEETAPECELY